MSEENKKNPIFSMDRILNYWWVLLILIPLCITIAVRLEPMKLVPMDKSAESSFYNYYRSVVRQEIDKTYPNLPAEKRAEIAEQQLNEIISKESPEKIQEQIKQNADRFKSKLQYQSGENTYVYLGDIDSYYWLRQSRNIIEKGTECDVIKEGVCYDSYTTAPNLLSKGIDYYPKVIVWVYKFLKIFNPDISLMQASFLTPLAFSLAFTIPLFLLLRKIGGNVTALIGTVFVNVNPHVLTRSLGSDSDITNVFFQIFFLWLAIECFYTDVRWKKIAWAALAGFLLSIYALFWMGWWYLADLFIIALIVKLAYVMIKQWRQHRILNWGELKNPVKAIAFTGGVFIASLFIFTSIFFGSFTYIVGVLFSQFSVLNFKVASNVNYWPNVLTTVAEFHSMNITDVINAFGRLWGMPLYLIALIGIAFVVFPNLKFINKNKIYFFSFIICNLVLYKLAKSSSNGTVMLLFMLPVLLGIFLHILSKEDEEFHPDAVFFLTAIILLVSIFSTIGARFLFLMAAPIGIFVALFVDKTSRIIMSMARSSFSLPKWFTTVSVIIIALVFIIQPVKNGFASAQNYIPNVSDDWVESLEKIRDNSKPDAIINSWWDFGHWFKYFADRRVTLDGSSQNSPQLHWLGKLLLTPDENLSVGILRMLDCGGNNAFDKINKRINDTPHSVDIINKIIVEKKDRAREILQEHKFTDDEIEDILSSSHCDPPENFLITSEDMIGKAGVWAHFGKWDFKRAYLSKNKDEPRETLIKKFEEDYDTPKQVTEQLLSELESFDNEDQVNYWISPWPSYMTGGFVGCNKKEKVYLCGFSNGQTNMIITVDFDKREAYIANEASKKVYPAAIAFVSDGEFQMASQTGETFPLGIVASKSGDSLSVLYMDPALTGSMFTRLFFLQGDGLKSFEKFNDVTTIFGERIITWKVNWNAS